MEMSHMIADASQSLQLPLPPRIITVSDLLYTCLRLRASPDEFSRYLNELLTTSPMESQLVCDNLIQRPHTVCPDPLHIQYIVSAVSYSPPIVSLPPLLTTLQKAPLDLRIDVLRALTPVVTKSWTPNSPQDVAQLVLGLASYLDEITATSNIFLEPVPIVNEALRDVVAGFVSALTENVNVDKSFGYGVGKEHWTAFESSLGPFIDYLRVINKPLGDDLAQKAKKFMSSGDQKMRPSTSTIEAEPKPPSGKLPWMGCMLERRPKFGSQDFTAKVDEVFSTQSSDSAICNLVSAAFESLSFCAMTHDHTRVTLWKYFIVNRLPAIFQKHISETPGSSLEYSLRRPLFMIDENALAIVNTRAANDIDVMFSAPTTPYDVRHEFLKSMAQLGLVSFAGVDRILGRNGGDLQSAENFEKPLVAEEMITSLLHMDYYEFENYIRQFVTDVETMGCLSQGAAVDVMAELLSLLSVQRETLKLRVLAQEIALSTVTMNIMLLYRDPYEIIRPLITCLDTWSYEDESNFQDNYTDFGLILLLVCSFYYHFQLDLAEMGPFNENSFCMRYLTSSGVGHPIDSLGQERSDLLGGWIMGLFDMNGISDDMMRSCSPMDYALLVPTIFQQSVAACNRNFMDVDTLKGGLEYFLQPFLLPSVVGALHWLANDLWTLRDFDIPLQILQALIIPQFLSDEARPIHKIVLRIGGLSIYNIIQEILRKATQLPDTINFNSIMDTLSPHVQFRKGL
ncbi:mediator complex subunit Med5-domain-containing protein [Lipomyces kononenkoae]